MDADSVNRVLQAGHAHVIAATVANTIEECVHSLNAYPTEVLGSPAAVAEVYRTFWREKYLAYNVDEAGLTIADMCWLAWAHCQAAADLSYRVQPGEGLPDMIEVDAWHSRILSEWSILDTDPGTIKEHLKVMIARERIAVKTAVYAISHRVPDEPMAAATFLNDTDDNPDLYDGLTTHEEIEEHKKAQTQTQTQGRGHEHDVDHDDGDESGIHRSAEAVAEEAAREADAIKTRLAARIGNLRAYRDESVRAAGFVARASRLFVFTEAQFDLIHHPRAVLHSELHSALSDREHVRKIVDDWILLQASNEISTTIEKVAVGVYYTMASRMGAREAYIRNRPGMDWTVATAWNVMMKDRDNEIAGFYSSVFDYKALKVLQTPESSPLKEAWTWAMWARNFMAYLRVDFISEYLVLVHSLLHRANDLRNRDHRLTMRRRLPYIVQLFNAYYVQNHNADHEIEYWYCRDYRDALYLWAHLVVTEYNAQLEDRQQCTSDLVPAHFLQRSIVEIEEHGLS
jgi:hypothetical protein